MDLKIREGFFLIPDFENYAIDPSSMKVMNLKKNIEISPLKTGRIKKFKLSKNGITYYLTLFEILKSVIKVYF